MYLITALFLVLSLSVIQDISWANETTPEQVKAFGLRIDYDVKGSYWFTSDDDDSEEGVGHALDYMPELIPVHAFQGELMWRDSSWLQLYYETALTSDSTEQDAVLEISDKESSIEKINAFLDLFFLNDLSGNSTLNFLSHLRLDYKHHVFFGKAEVQENTQYISADSSPTALAPGDEIRFKSDFEEISVNLRVSTDFWVGYYQYTTVKPHEASTQVRQVLETEITGTGVKFLTDSDTFTFDANLGIVKFRADQGNFRSDGFETTLHGEWRPHIYLIGSDQSKKNSRHNLVLIPLIGVQFSMQIGGEAEGQESDGTGELSMDIIVDAGLRLQYQF